MVERDTGGVADSDAPAIPEANTFGQTVGHPWELLTNVMQSASSDVDRRRFLQTAAAIGLAGPLVAGCSGDGDDGSGGGGGNETDESSGEGNEGGATVVAGPGGNFTFDPGEVTIGTGETVTWEFETASHNVECDPSATDEASLPEGADPFTSYEGDDRFDTNDAGTTFEHTFDVAGTYTYVCVPHIGSDMIGTVVVE